MSRSSHIYDISPADFNTMALENSFKGLVLVYFWSQNVGPCMKLFPVLIKLADEFSGRFLLNLLDTDRHKRYVRDMGVISIPTVQFYLRGEVVETLHGAFSEGTIRSAIEKALDQSAAIRIGSDQSVPDRPFANALERAKKLLLKGEAINAAALLDSLPREALEIPEIGLVKTHADLIRVAQLAPERQAIVQRIEDDPRDFLSLYQLAALNLVADDYQSALELLLSIRNRSSDPDMADRALRSILAVFALLGESHPLVERFSGVLNQFGSTDSP